MNVSQIHYVSDYNYHKKNIIKRIKSLVLSLVGNPGFPTLEGRQSLSLGQKPNFEKIFAENV